MDEYGKLAILAQIAATYAGFIAFFFAAGLLVMTYVARHQLALPVDEARQISVGWHVPG